MHPDNPFRAIAKDAGRFMACAQARWPVADGGTRCGWIDIR
jgi:hypothetical protein